MRWEPRDAVLVRYAEDPVLWRWRGIVRPVADGRYQAVSPDREVFELDLEHVGEGQRFLAVRGYDGGGRLPRG
eukprot:11132850-Lingulodinium_polyedra.AAC.1